MNVEVLIAAFKSALGANAPQNTINIDISGGDFVVESGLPFAIYSGDGGNIAIEGANGNSEILVGVPAGTFVLGTWKKVLQTGSTATNMIAMY